MAKGRTIRPKKLQFNIVARKLLGPLTQVGRAMREDFEATVETWDQKPTFNIKTTASTKSIKMRIWTDDPIWNLLDCGADPHPIDAVQADKLVFPYGYQPKTAPDHLWSKEGGEFGDNVYADHVDHPGFEARRWTCAVAEKWDCKIKDLMQCAVKDAVLVSCR